MSIRRMTRCTLAFLLAIACVPEHAATSEQHHRWQFSASGAYRSIDTSVEDFEQAMVRGHLDGYVCGNEGEILCFWPKQPESDEDKLSYTLQLSYAINPRLRLQAVYSPALFGSTHGYYDGGITGTWDSDAWLIIDRKQLTTYGLLLQYCPVPTFYYAIGPALYSLKLDVVTGAFASEPDYLYSGERLGLIAALGMTIPGKSTMFLHTGIQMRYTGAFRIGPYDAKNESGEVLTSMPPTDVSMNHVLVFVGLGFRI